MKILYFFSHAAKSNGRGGYNYYHLRPALRGLGHKIVDLDFSDEIKRYGKNETASKLRRLLQEEKPDIFLHGAESDELDEVLAEYIKNETSTTSILFPQVEWDESRFLSAAGHYNVALLIGSEAGNGKAGHDNVIPFQWGCNPLIWSSIEKKRGYPVVFVGRASRERAEMVNYLRGNGIDIRLWGAGWEAIPELRGISRGFLPYYKMLEVIGSSVIVLNLEGGEPRGNRDQVEKRVFEAFSCKAFQITHRRSETANLFEEGKEIVLYNDEQDLLDKVRFFEAHQRERQDIAEKGYKKAVTEYSWQNRFEELFARIQENSPANKSPVICRAAPSVKSIEDSLHIPKVSVITYVYNGEPYIEDAIVSVLDQTYRDFEYLILDDGSTDNTAQIVGKYLKDGRLKYVYQENIGHDLLHFDELVMRSLQHTTGELFTVIGSDDVYMPDKLDRELKEFEMDPEVDIVFSDLVFMDSRGTIIPGDYKCSDSYNFDRRTLLRMLFKKNIIAHPTVMMKRKVVELLGGFETGFAADYHFWLKGAPHLKFKFLDRKLMKYRVHEKGASTGSGQNAIALAESNKVVATMRDSYTILDLYPEIEECENKGKALHDAYLEFGKDLLTANVPQPQLALTQFRYALQHVDNSPMAINNAGIAYMYMSDLQNAYDAFVGMKKFPFINDEMRKNIATFERIIRRESPETVNFIIATETPEQSELVRIIRPRKPGESRQTGNRDILKETYDSVGLLADAGRYEEAIAELEHLLDFYPYNPTIYNDLGVFHYHGGLLGAALGYFERALYVDSSFVDARRNMLNLHLEIGNYPETIETLEALLQERPEDEELVLIAAQIFERCGQLENAVYFYQTALRMDPGCAAAAQALDCLGQGNPAPSVDQIPTA